MRKLRFLYIVLICIVFTTLHSQTLQWSKTFGGNASDWGFCGNQSLDGGFIILGTNASIGPGGTNFYLIKTDSNGDTLWTKTYPGAIQQISTVQQTADSGYVIVGTTDSFGAGENDIYLIKTDAFGNTTWTKTYGGAEMEFGFDVQQTTDCGYFITGRTKSFGMGNWDYYFVRTNSFGDSLWTKTYGGSGNDRARAGKQTYDGGFIVAGETSLTQYGGEKDICLINTDSSGNLIWTKKYGGIGNDEAWDVQQTSDNGFIITATTNSFGMGNWDYYLIKTDPLGDTLWTKTYGGFAGDGARSCKQTSDGGYIISGWSCSFGGSYQAWIVKTNATGDILWDQVLGGFDQDESQSIDQTSDGGYISVGMTRSYGAGDADIWVIKLLPDTLTNINRNKLVSENHIIYLYPNPATDNISLVSQSEIVVKSIEIIDLQGKLFMHQGEVNENFLLDVSHFPKGLYIARINTNKGVAVQKLVIQ